MGALYKLVWNGEVIEGNLSIDEAKYLKGEYNLKYKGGVTIKMQ